MGSELGAEEEEEGERGFAIGILERAGEEVRGAHAAQTKFYMLDFGHVVDVAEAELVHGEFSAIQRIAFPKEFVLAHSLGAAEDGVFVVKDGGGFKEEAIERFSRMVAVLAPGEGGLTSHVLPGFVVADGGCDAV